MTFDPTPRGFFSAMGVTVEQAAAVLEEDGEFRVVVDQFIDKFISFLQNSLILHTLRNITYHTKDLFGFSLV